MSYWDLLESRIKEGIESGAFRDLPGEGKPLVIDESDALAGDNWLGHKILRDNDIIPEWMMLAKEIERDLERLREIGERFENFAGWAAEEHNWPAYAGRLARVRQQYADLARATRRKQDQFNHKVPGPSLERPGIWVEYLLSRLDDTLAARGAPPDLLTLKDDVA